MFRSVRLISTGRPSTSFQYQKSLPPLPIPTLAGSAKRLAAAAAPLRGDGVEPTASFAAALAELNQGSKDLAAAVGSKDEPDAKAILRWLSSKGAEAEAAVAALSPAAAAQVALARYADGEAGKSYINSFWSQVYLRDWRMALPININPFLVFTPEEEVPPAHASGQHQVHVAARHVAAALAFRNAVDAETLRPDAVHMGPNAGNAGTESLDGSASLLSSAFADLRRLGPKSIAASPAAESAIGKFLPASARYAAAYLSNSYPLDMSQYPHLLRSCRVPEAGADRLVRADAGGPDYLVVARDGHFYRLAVLDMVDADPAHPSNVAAVTALSHALASIVSDATARGPATHAVGSLTSLDRDTWATAYETLRQEPRNAESLDIIHRSLFLLSLDRAMPHDNVDVARSFLVGTASKSPLSLDRRSRWWDKSFQLIVSGTGTVGVNFEHAWGDGVSVMRFANEVFAHVRGIAPTKPSDPASVDLAWSRLDWKLSTTTKEHIRTAETKFDEAAKSLNYGVAQVAGAGKDMFKAARVSPDGIVQQAIQLAHRRVAGGGPAVSTYESASTSGFARGRTDVIRPATIESDAFVRAAMAGNASEAHLRAAADKHSTLAREAVLGQAFDRHLFALNRLVAERSMTPLALAESSEYSGINENILSTSTLASPAISGGGFGPAAAEGFGVGYSLTAADAGFSVTSYRPDLDQFIAELHRALDECRRLLKQ
jgi:carnitine O-palmitoyltransferase 2